MRWRLGLEVGKSVFFDGEGGREREREKEREREREREREKEREKRQRTMLTLVKKRICRGRWLCSRFLVLLGRLA
jgi:hypothetical protein